MTMRFTARSAARRGAFIAFALIAVVLVAAAPCAAFAAVSSVKTATTQATYQNPATGQIEDSGGTSNQALGESMVSSTTDSNALIETDASGKVFITLRIHLADQIKGVAVETSADGGSTFAAAQATKMQEDLSHGDGSQDNTFDWRFEAPSADAVMRVKLDVIPMGREVTYFVKLVNPVDGNAAGFVQSVTPGEGSDDTAATESSDSAAKGDAADSSSDGSSSESDGDTATSTDDLNEQSGSSDAGISEYNADGNKVNDDGAQPISGGTAAMIAGAVIVVAAIAGGVYYLVAVRPKRARQAAAAAAAADDAFDRAAGTASPTRGASKADGKSGKDA